MCVLLLLEVIKCPKGPRGKIPPNFTYVHVDIGLQGGLAHIIEDPRWKRGFVAGAVVKEILCPHLPKIVLLIAGGKVEKETFFRVRKVNWMPILELF